MMVLVARADPGETEPWTLRNLFKHYVYGSVWKNGTILTFAPQTPDWIRHCHDG